MAHCRNALTAAPGMPRRTPRRTITTDERQSGGTEFASPQPSPQPSAADRPGAINPRPEPERYAASAERRGKAFAAVEWSAVLLGIVGVVVNLRWLATLLAGPPARIGVAWLLPTSVAWLVAGGTSVWLLQRGPAARRPPGAGLLLIVTAAGFLWLSLRYATDVSALGRGLEFVLAAGAAISTLALIYLLYERLVMGVLHFLFAFAISFVAFDSGRNLAGAVILVWCVVGILLSQWLKVEFGRWDTDSRIFAAARDVASKFVMVNARLHDSIDRASTGARIRERVRVAREIHDGVGYTLTALLIQVQAAQDILREDPEALRARLERLEDLIRSSIQDVRAEVSDLRDESVVERSGSNRWRRLCESFSEGTGVRVHTNIPDDLEQVPPNISEVVYRITQEALTNAYRHGAAGLIDVSAAWECEAQRILVRISDNGKGAKTINPGNGLRGMRERAGELGGSVVWQSEERKGFDLGVEIPWDGCLGE